MESTNITLITKMDNTINLENVIKDLKALNTIEKKEGVLNADLAKELAESFKLAYKSLTITNNITQ
jgi:hypothetical protein